MKRTVLNKIKKLKSLNQIHKYELTDLIDSRLYEIINETKNGVFLKKTTEKSSHPDFITLFYNDSTNLYHMLSRRWIDKNDNIVKLIKSSSVIQEDQIIEINKSTQFTLKKYTHSDGISYSFNYTRHSINITKFEDHISLTAGNKQNYAEHITNNQSKQKTIIYSNEISLFIKENFNKSDNSFYNTHTKKEKELVTLNFEIPIECHKFFFKR